MIRYLKNKEFSTLKKIAYKNRLSNPYIYLDICNDGFYNKNVYTLVLENKSIIKLLIYYYYGSIQLLKLRRLSNNELTELINYLIKNKIKRVSGEISTLKNICSKNLKYKYSKSYLMINTNFYNNAKTKIIKKAKRNDCKIIAKILMGCAEYKSSYTLEMLHKQLRDRLIKYNCNVYYIKQNNEIISVFAEYAKFKDLVVLGGLYTKPEYRTHGYATILVKYLSNIAKNTCIYVVNDRLLKFYENLNYKIIKTFAKIELDI